MQGGLLLQSRVSHASPIIVFITPHAPDYRGVSFPLHTVSTGRRGISGLQYPQRPNKRREQTRKGMRQPLGHLPSNGNLAHCLPFPHLWEGMTHDMAGTQHPWDSQRSQVVIPHIPTALGEVVYIPERMVTQGEGSCVLVCDCALEGQSVRAGLG